MADSFHSLFHLQTELRHCLRFRSRKDHVLACGVKYVTLCMPCRFCELEIIARKMLDLVIVVATAVIGLLIILFWVGWSSEEVRKPYITNL